MKVKHLIIGFTAGLLISAFIFPSVVHAFDPFAGACSGAGVTSAACTGRGNGGNPVAFAIGRVVQLVSLLAGFASVVVIIVAGFRYVISSGDSNNINGAKNAILFAVVGLAISVAAGTIVGYILNRI